MKHLIFTLAAFTLAASCQSAEPPGSTTTGAGAEGGDAGTCVSPPPEVQFPPPFHPQSTCCNDQTCRGACSSLLTGNGNEMVTQCTCGQVTFDGQAHHGPPGCAEGEECCVQPLGNNLCLPKGQCVDCTPATSSKWAVSGCCAATTTCRGYCGAKNAGPCSCEQPGDGGCAEGSECCVHPLTSKHTCVPLGECHFDLGPCPPAASSASVAVDCCNELPCRGRYEDPVEGPLTCNCGGSWGGCKLDEECCLGPSGKNLDPATHCVPMGTCSQGG